ncbi:MAG TPA: DoxX family protein [Actinophytocola sp.]|uniref:DoxX family protein n=1 Tax=Actinophytocola sp. TaxID=1872138 RepID=UPI002DDD615E|nr:DoxX family protein [Actinophytocola sp.]HEV2780652.1 DoxX family protein [Actinophytocola sp.]
MNVVLWIAQGLVAAVFLAAGLMKLSSPAARPAGRTPLLSPRVSVVMGVVDVVGAAGVILPAATGIAPVLTPVAAVGTGVVMVGAIPLHARHGDRTGVVACVVTLLLSVFIAWGRFGPYAL